MDMWRNIPAGSNVPEIINAIISTAKGSRTKYSFVNIGGNTAIKVQRYLKAPLFYPFDEGMIPQTYWENKFPMNVIVLTREPAYPGCIIEVKPVGLLKTTDNGHRDDKVIAVPCGDALYERINDISKLPLQITAEITDFLTIYAASEGKKADILGWEGAKYAQKAILHGIKLFKEKIEKSREE